MLEVEKLEAFLQPLCLGADVQDESDHATPLILLFAKPSAKRIRYPSSLQKSRLADPNSKPLPLKYTACDRCRNRDSGA